MKKLLIADSSHIFTSALAKQLASQFHVLTCTDGIAALELLQSQHPDALVLNFSLPYIDGLTLLQKTDFRPPVILAISMYPSAYADHAAASLGVSYSLVSPTVDTVAVRLLDLSQHRPTGKTRDSCEGRTLYHLEKLGFPTHIDGYHELCIALPLFIANPRQTLTKELYPAVGKCFGDRSGEAVEHSIRKAIQSVWKQRKRGVWEKYFPGRTVCPTNKVFLFRLAELITNPPKDF